MKSTIIILLTILTYSVVAQNKSAYTFIWGGGGVFARFAGDTSRPITGQLYSNNPPYIIFSKGSSNICDSSTSKLLMLSNGYVLYDTLGNIIENGDSLVPQKIYAHNVFPISGVTQGSLILPKGSNGLYYLFTPTISDSAYTFYVTNGGGGGAVPYDLLQYHVVDMNANGGAGKVVQKNIPALTNVKMSKVGMMACRHANGYDWWLVKQAADTNMMYVFLVTADTVILKNVQGFSSPHFGYFDLVGQSCFSTDGSKYAYLQGDRPKLFVADFDRCYGVFSNPREFNIPVDSTTHPVWILDSSAIGVCFSPNDKFIYIAQDFHIYQLEYNEPDSLLAWSKIKKGADTILSQFAKYGQLYKGLDGRIYIGKFGGSGIANSVIDHPDLKGLACGFCARCLRCDTSGYGTTAPSNMPDFNLGAIAVCPPLGVNIISRTQEELEVYPNPTNTKFQIKYQIPNSKKELFNSVGQLIFTTNKNEIDVSNYSKGVYYLRCGFQTKKIIIE